MRCTQVRTAVDYGSYELCMWSGGSLRSHYVPLFSSVFFNSLKGACYGSLASAGNQWWPCCWQWVCDNDADLL